jgi:FlaA1/EpsC-like NDP-sugar epimerase
LGKRLLVALVDIALCVLTVWLAFYLRLGDFFPLFSQMLWPILVAIVLSLPVFYFFGLYQAIFRYAGFSALVALLKAMAVYGLIYASTFTVFSTFLSLFMSSSEIMDGVPRTIGLIQPLLMLLAVGGSRVFARYWLGGHYQSNGRRKLLPKVLIYGCGSAGRQLATVMIASQDVIVCGFLDDDRHLQGNTINGIQVYDPGHCSTLCQSMGISEILLALPAISRSERNRILERVSNAKVVVRTLPSLMDITTGKITIADLHELDVDDLLGRLSVEPQLNLLSKHVSSQVVMVTGAGGSIGGELCQQILKLNPTVILLVEQSEFALYDLHQKLLFNLNNAALLGKAVEDIGLIPLLGSVRDEARMREIIFNWNPHIIYHAAAYKHVPLVEHNPVEGIRNNVLGTLVTAKIAGELGVKNFVLISTDKAVRPTNIMGASKRLAEMTLQAIAGNFPDTQFSMVRFGNVLGSSGSVVPKFRQQIKDGGPIHLTHLEITRYFMSIPEAAQLVIQAGAIATGGEVFVLDMGQPVKIFDLARRMVELSGLTLKDEDHPDGDIEIEVTGLRPGEKLYEELLIGDNPESTSHPLIMKASEAFLPWGVFSEKMTALQAVLDANDVVSIKAMLQELVSGYTPDPNIVDWIHLSKESGGVNASPA